MKNATLSTLARGIRDGLVAVSIKPSRVTAVLPLLFFGATFIVYYVSSPGPTVYNTPIYLADSLLHGRLHIPGAENIPALEWAPYKGKYYMVEPPMAALVLLPGVVLYGFALNQTLASIVVGSLTAPAVFRLVRGLGRQVSVQIWLTVLFMFGTIYWWNASNGSIWQLSHTIAVLFLFLAIYETLVAKRPFLAGFFLGAAFLARLPTILSLPFFIIMFADQWLPRSAGKSLLQRIDLLPIVQFGVGLSIFVVIAMGYYYLAFDTPLPAAHHYYFEQFEKTDPVLAHGVFDIDYVPRHLPVIFENLPNIQSEAPYVVPFGNGIAIWATTPAFLYSFFAGVRDRRLVTAGVALLAISLLVMFLSADGPRSIQPFHLDVPGEFEFYPFAFLVIFGLIAGLRDRFVLACWSAIIPISFLIFNYAIPGGWVAYADRFALDYYPFLFLLTVRAIGDDLKWHHAVLISLGIIVNLWGVLWIYQFDKHRFLGLRWAPW